MALTLEQIAKEKQNEAKLNQLSEKVIGMTGWGKFYPLMKIASQAGQGLTPHKVCISADGREVTVYKDGVSKVATWFKPAHEYATAYASQGKWGKATLAILFPVTYGQTEDLKKQKSATCTIVIPNEVVDLVNNTPSYDPNTGARRTSSNNTTISTPTTTQQFFNKRNIIITTSVAAGVGLLFGVLKFGKVI